MPDWLRIAILGMIEGVTEFLPVSSTGHLILAEAVFNHHQTPLFNTLIQSGAVLAVLVVFARRASNLVLGWRQPENLDYLLKLGAAFVLTAIGGLLMKKMGWKLPTSAVPVAWATLIGGVLFLLVERLFKHRSGVDTISWQVALAVGASQLVAAGLPGASRSGTTILFALALGVSRPAATEFSFLLGIPTLLAAGLKETLDAVRSSEPHEPWSQLALGCIVAAVTAFLVVRWLLGYVRSKEFTPFAWYRIALGLGMLLAAFQGWVK